MANGIVKAEEMVIELPNLFCKRCGHHWHPRVNNLPKVCPKCKSVYWNKEKVRRV